MDYSILKNKTVLIADDEVIILKIASQFFLYYGCHVISAPNGAVAVQLATTKQPDLIIMDWNMPVMDGLEATKQLKTQASTKNIPIIIATGISDSSEFLHNALANGADDYLAKPLDERVMIARAISVLRLYERSANLTDANMSKDRILATVAHDLRNPIQAIQGVATILKLQLKDPADSDIEVINLIDTSCKKALHLISELLESSEMDSATFVLHTTPTAIDIFIHRTLKGFLPRIEEKQLNLTLDLRCEDAYAEIHHQKFARVIENLVSNAIKFTPEQGSIHMKSFNVDDQIKIEIEDSGIGIPEDLQSVIFDKFSKAGRSGLKGEKSTGLGMYIVKQIVELHDGQISLFSAEGQGTRFSITLPYFE